MVLGVTNDRNVDDLLESPSLAIIELLRAMPEPRLTTTILLCRFWCAGGTGI